MKDKSALFTGRPRYLALACGLMLIVGACSSAATTAPTAAPATAAPATAAPATAAPATAAPATAAPATAAPATAAPSAAAGVPNAWFKNKYQANGTTKTVKVGVLVPYTGGYAADAHEIWQAINMSIDDINAAGGVITQDGTTYKLEAALGDTLDQRPDQVTSAVQKLFSDGVDISMTAYASQTNFEFDLMAAQSMPYLVSGGANETRAIISKDPAKYWNVWSFVPSYDAYNTEFPKIVDQWAKDGLVQFSSKKVFFITSDIPYSKAIAEGQRKGFEALGWTTVGYEVVPFGTISDWRSLLAKIRSDPPAVIVNTDYQASNDATFMKQFREAPTNSIVFIQYGPINQEYCDLAGAEGVGVLYQSLGGAIMGGNSESAQMAKEVATKYVAKYGPTGYFYNTGYWMAQLYARAIQETGDPSNHRAIGDWFSKLDVITGSGHLQFDPTTHLGVYGNENLPLQVWQIGDSCTRPLLFPPNLTTDKFQLPPWAKNPLP
jgi:branched-chain amino acid transport system substrate-binding protein